MRDRGCACAGEVRAAAAGAGGKRIEPVVGARSATTATEVAPATTPATGASRATCATRARRTGAAGFDAGATSALCTAAAGKPGRAGRGRAGLACGTTTVTTDTGLIYGPDLTYTAAARAYHLAITQPRSALAYIRATTATTSRCATSRTAAVIAGRATADIDPKRLTRGDGQGRLAAPALTRKDSARGDASSASAVDDRRYRSSRHDDRLFSARIRKGRASG